MPDINMKNSIDLNFLPLSNAFIEQYITRAKPVFVCIYIYSFKKCLDGQTLTLKQIADDFDILESDVLSAWKFWKKENVIEFKQNGDNFFVEFLSFFSLKNSLTVNLENDSKNNYDKNLEEPQKKEILIVPPVSQGEKTPLRNFKRGDIPSYTVEEINIYSENDEVKKLFKVAEEAFSSMLDFSRMKLVFGFYDWLGMPIDVIGYLIKYCISEKKSRSLKYIESVALDWCEKGIDSIEKAEEHIKKFNISYREIMKAFGITNTAPIERQIKYMDDWLSKLSIDLIKEAGQRTIMSIGNPRFDYADSIIQRWFKAGVKNFSDVEKCDLEFNKKKSENKNKLTENKYYKKSNKFINYEQRDWDFDALNKLKIELSD